MKNIKEESYTYNLTDDEVILIKQLLNKTPINATIITHYPTDNVSPTTYEVMRINVCVGINGVNGVV